MIGISRNSPGPFGGDFSRPRRKMTPRSYSRATRIADESTISRRTAIAASAIRAPNASRILCHSGLFLGPVHFEHEAVLDALHPDRGPRFQRIPTRPGLPELAPDEDEAVRR